MDFSMNFPYLAWADMPLGSQRVFNNASKAWQSRFEEMFMMFNE
jgi:hypothetical protein